MSLQPTVRYQVLTDGEGLSIDDNMLQAYVDGKSISSAPVRSDANLHQLLLTYQVIGLLPEVKFSFTAPSEHEVKVSMDLLSLPGEVSGTLTFDGMEHLWFAELKRHPDFLRLDEIPPGYSPYITDDGRGYHYILSAYLQTHPDPVVNKKLACILDDFIRALDSKSPVEYPYIRHFTNVFSLKEPVWHLNVPRVVSLEERNRGSYA